MFFWCPVGAKRTYWGRPSEDYHIAWEQKQELRLLRLRCCFLGAMARKNSPLDRLRKNWIFLPLAEPIWTPALNLYLFKCKIEIILPTKSYIATQNWWYLKKIQYKQPAKYQKIVQISRLFKSSSLQMTMFNWLKRSKQQNWVYRELFGPGPGVFNI